MWSNSWNECNQLRIRDLHVIIFFPSVAIKKKKFCWPPARQKRDFLFCWRLPIKIQIQKFSSSLLSKSTIYILTGLTVKSKIQKFVSHQTCCFKNRSIARSSLTEIEVINRSLNSITFRSQHFENFSLFLYYCPSKLECLKKTREFQWTIF